MTPPIRFLALVVGGWTIGRAVALVADLQPVARGGLPQKEATFAANAVPSTVTQFPEFVTREHTVPPRPLPLLASLSVARSVVARPGRSPRPARAPDRAEAPHDQARRATLVSPTDFAAPARPAAEVGPASPLPFQPTPTRVRVPSRLSGSAWMLAREAGEGAIASNGLLGGSQAGTRVTFRVNDDIARPLSLSMRVSSPLRRDGVEAAAGMEWQPFAGVPVRVLAERRQRVSGEGRSAFALLAHGGVSDRPVAAGFRLDGYAQAGVVGARSRDLFADAGATLVRPLNGDRPGGLAVGAGIWGGAQPGASRVDAGPRLTATLAGDRARVSLDWRFRVAGKSAPASGPSLTVGTGF